MSKHSCFFAISFMKFECQLAGLLEGHTALDVGDAADVERAFREQHPRLPLGVAWTVPRMAAVFLTRTDVDAATAEGLHRTEAAVCLFRAFGSVRFRDDAVERTGRTAVRLLCRQLDCCCVVFGHIVCFLVVKIFYTIEGGGFYTIEGGGFYTIEGNAFYTIQGFLGHPTSSSSFHAKVPSPSG